MWRAVLPTSSMSVVRKHVWTSARRGAGGCSRPRKYGLKGCIPAVVSRTEGSCTEGTSDAEGTILCPRSAKKDRYVSRISFAFMLGSLNICQIGHLSGQAPPIAHSGKFGLIRAVPHALQPQMDRSFDRSRRRQPMKLRMMLVVGITVLSLGLVPTAGMADGPDYQPEGPTYHPEHPSTPQGPKSAPKGKAYGYYCRGQSKKHVKGEKGTAFSRCVKALAQADKNDNLNAKKACKALSK